MSQERTAQVMRTYLEEAVGKGNMDVIKEFTADDFIDHSQPDARGPSALIDHASGFRTTFPDPLQIAPDPFSGSVLELFGCLWCFLGVLWAASGALWRPLGATLVSLCCIVGPLGHYVGELWQHLR